MKQRGFFSMLVIVAAACSKGAPPPSLAIINARVWTGDSTAP